MIIHIHSQFYLYNIYNTATYLGYYKKLQT